LTRDLFNNQINPPNDSLKLSENEEKKLLKLKDFLGTDLESPDNLEILASLCYLKSIPEGRNKSDKDIIELLFSRKPFINKDKIEDFAKKLHEFSNN
jgi:hypothetical protein